MINQESIENKKQNNILCALLILFINPIKED